MLPLARENTINIIHNHQSFINPTYSEWLLLVKANILHLVLNGKSEVLKGRI